MGWEGAAYKDHEEGFLDPAVLPWGNTLLIPRARALTGELLAPAQVQRRERHVLEGCNVTW